MEGYTEEELTFTPQCGIVPGGSITAQIFQEVHHKMMERWNGDTEEEDKAMWTESVAGGRRVRTGVTSFVDDVAKMVISKRHTKEGGE